MQLYEKFNKEMLIQIHPTSSFANTSESKELDYPVLGQKAIAEYKVHMDTKNDSR